MDPSLTAKEKEQNNENKYTNALESCVQHKPIIYMGVSKK